MDKLKKSLNLVRSEESCIHVTKDEWNYIFATIEKPETIASVVVMDSLNVKPFYIPGHDFRFFPELNEFWHSPPIFATENEFLNWMADSIGKKTYLFRIHVCDATEILKKIVTKFPNLNRICFHFFILNKKFFEYLISTFPSLTMINFENSIGIRLEECRLLTKLSDLQHLNLTGSDIYEDSLEVLVKNCRGLKSLNIANNCGITGRCLVWINPSLQRLDLRDCWRVEEESIIAMVRLPLSSLRELLANSGITDQSLIEICKNCRQLSHLLISYDYFYHNDNTGRRALSDDGFSAIGNLEDLQILTLKHVGKLTDSALQNILKGSKNLSELTLNLRHRHQLTDNALADIGKWCPKLLLFESVHNHFIAKQSIISISSITQLVCLQLRGNDMVDDDIVRVVTECPKLVFLGLDGSFVTELTLNACIQRARQMPKVFKVSLISTLIDRSSLISVASDLPNNLRIRVSGPQNLQHFTEFNGKQVLTKKLKQFFPHYWVDFT